MRTANISKAASAELWKHNSKILSAGVQAGLAGRALTNDASGGRTSRVIMLVAHLTSEYPIIKLFPGGQTFTNITNITLIYCPTTKHK